MQARQQFSRERLVAAAELKIMHEQLAWCYHKHGVNHYEECRPLVNAIAAATQRPYFSETMASGAAVGTAPNASEQ